MPYRPLLTLIAFALLLGSASAQELSSIEYNYSRYDSERSSGPATTYRTYRNRSTTTERYELEVTFERCETWSFGLSLLRRAELAGSTKSCSRGAYAYATDLHPGKTVRTTRTEHEKIDYYRIKRVAIYRDGSDLTLDTYYGYRRSDFSTFGTRVY
jgi:hypothetical protein